jgi:class 3 adenylate cyclase
MTTTAATPQQIANLRRRYLLMAASPAGIDLVFTLVFLVLTDAWSFAPRSIGAGLFLLLGVNLFLSWRRYQPIQRFLEGRASFEDTQRRLTQLPILTAQHMALLVLALTLFRLTYTWVFTDPSVTGVPRPTIADVIALCIILPVFYFTYTYFVISDYLAGLCTFIFRQWGRTLGLFFGSYTAKLIVALLTIAVLPLAAIIVDLFSYDDERLRFEISNDAVVAIMAVIITGVFIGRSLLRPLRILTVAMGKVAEGDLDLSIPVTSNDEVGKLTGQFNTMVQGLREREKIRETFGRYVDESVAATILRREGEGALAGETREATILFTDIQGFTTIAEYLPPDQLITALNEYLETVLAPIRTHGGVVNTFIGDGLFASFNMPLACEGHATAALRAAIDIQRAVGQRTFGDRGVAFATRIGISTGHVIGGSVGAGQRLSFTLLGDTVNLAARLEELNKQHGTRILIAESTRLASDGSFAFEPLGKVAVRGRSDPVAVFSVDPHAKGQESKGKES